MPKPTPTSHCYSKEVTSKWCLRHRQEFRFKSPSLVSVQGQPARAHSGNVSVRDQALHPQEPAQVSALSWH